MKYKWVKTRHLTCDEREVLIDQGELDVRYVINTLISQGGFNVRHVTLLASQGGLDDRYVMEIVIG